MGVQDPIILKEIKGLILNLRNRIRNTGQVDVFASHAEALISEQNLQHRNPEAVNAVATIVTEVASALLSNEETTPIGANVNQDDEESTILRDGVARLHQFEDSSVPDPILELRKARVDDIREQKMAEDEEFENLDDDVLELEIFCMHCPKVKPITITGILESYSDIEWHRRAGPNRERFREHLHKVEEKTPSIVPGLWIRRTDSYPWGPSYYWTHVRLAEDIDRCSTMVDVVNVAHVIDMDEKKDYLVLSLVDNGTEYPLPLGVPKLSVPPTVCCAKECQTLRRHLTTLSLTQRRIQLVGRITKKKEVDKEILDKVFDTANFLERQNDLYIKYYPPRSQRKCAMDVE